MDAMDDELQKLLNFFFEIFKQNIKQRGTIIYMKISCLMPTRILKALCYKGSEVYWRSKSLDIL